MRFILYALLFLMPCLPTAQAEEQPTFLGKTLTGWRQILTGKSATMDERRQALWAIGCFGPEAREATPELMELVRRGELKDEATGALTAIGASPEATVPPLIEQFVKQGCEHRTGQGTFIYSPSVENALVRIGGPAVPALLNLLNGPDKDMRVCAAAALGEVGPAARAAVPALIRAVERPDTDPTSPRSCLRCSGWHRMGWSLRKTGSRSP